MAEAAMFSVAAKLLITIASPTFKKAYAKACSIKSARKDLNKLERSIETIQSVLLDAEKKENSSAAVKNWIKRVRDVLYDAEDLFDEVVTDDLLRKQISGNSLLKKVQAFTSSSLNPILSDNSVAKRVKDIRRSLTEISEDMKTFMFVECINERQVGGMRNGQDPGLLFVDSESVIGRDKDKEAILGFLLAESSSNVSVIVIVGIGGMGKTTLAQLVYNDEQIKTNFENRWCACIADSSDDKEVIGKIYQSTCGGRYEHLAITDLQTQTREEMKEKKFLLILDDVWDEDRARWQSRMGLFSGGAKGSKVIVTTRSLSVARAVGGHKTHYLDGLSEEKSWDLFKSVVSFTPEQENDSRWSHLGREIVKKCANVPLAIKCIASLLFEKNTIQEWESFRNEELPKLGQNHKDGIMPVLKLSYEHLRSNLKHCFAYCSLFPKDYLFNKDGLIYLWISQGYIKPDNDEQNIQDLGHTYFMELYRRSFFQLISEYGSTNHVQWWKMHDLIHDLAQHVAGEDSVTMAKSSNEIVGRRHVSIDYDVNDSLEDFQQLQNVKRLRSFLYLGGYSSSPKPTLEIQLPNFMSLRALNLSSLSIEIVPSSIGELKHLRYLDISGSEIRNLPDAIIKLVNLCTLNISFCRELEVLPNDFRKMINLKDLINNNCYNLRHMPPGFEEFTRLQRLDCFRVGKGIGSKVDVLSGLNLRGRLEIGFRNGDYGWDGVEYWQPPLNLLVLRLYDYTGLRIPRWGGNGMTDSLLPKLTTLSISSFPRVKCLPHFFLPNLNDLCLYDMGELEYIHGEEEEGKQSHDAFFIPNIKKLQLVNLPKLKGWSGKAPPQLLSMPSLSELKIRKCPELSLMPLCPNLHKLYIDHSSTSIISSSFPSLESLEIDSCHEMVSFPGESFTSLRRLYISICLTLNEMHLAPTHLNILEYLEVSRCPNLELWEESKRGVDWDSLPKLTKLILDQVPTPEKIPDCLRSRQELGILIIKNGDRNALKMSQSYIS